MHVGCLFVFETCYASQKHIQTLQVSLQRETSPFPNQTENSLLFPVHEQLNAMIKGDGGATRITENEVTLSRWVIAGPEIMRILHEFEDGKNSSPDDLKHDEQKPACQKRFKEDVSRLIKVFEDNNLRIQWSQKHF